RIVNTPKPATHHNMMSPARPRIGHFPSAIAMTAAPTPGALRSSPSPQGPVLRISLAYTGSSHSASEEHGEHIERDRSKNYLFPPNVTEPGHHRMQGHLFGRARFTPGSNAQSCHQGNRARGG